MRSLAHIEEITAIRPIPKADRIEVATVLGWEIVVKKGEYKVGDKVIYIEIDSRVPKENPYFEFLEDRKYKVKSIKLKKQISQGLIAPMSLLDDKKYKIGDDVTGVLNITKINDDFVQTPASKEATLRQKHKKLYNKKWFKYLMKYEWFRTIVFKVLLPKKKRKFPDWVIKTDETRLQNIPSILENKTPFCVTEKIDGASTTFTLKKKGLKWKFYVCSRNILQDTPNKKCYYDEIGNVYWEMAKKYKIEEALNQLAVKNTKDLHFITIQGETYGEGIQKNKYGIKGREFRAFNLYFGYEDRVDYIDMPYAKIILDKLFIPSVPIISLDYILPDTIDEVMEYVTGESELADTLREGYVFRARDKRDNVISFKCVSNEFLLKWGL